MAYISREMVPIATKFRMKTRWSVLEINFGIFYYFSDPSISIMYIIFEK